MFRKWCLACLLKRGHANDPYVMCERCAHELATYVVFTQWCPVQAAEELVEKGE